MRVADCEGDLHFLKFGWFYVYDGRKNIYCVLLILFHLEVQLASTLLKLLGFYLYLMH